jgi:hypothetical protein
VIQRCAAGALPMRRRICLSLLLLLPAKTDAAAACSVSLPSVEKLYAGASAAFVGRLVRIEEAGVVSTGELLPPRMDVEATFRVVEVLKGEPPAGGKLRAPIFEACGPILLAGWEYLFLLHEGNFIRSWERAIPVHNWPNGRERLLEKLGIGKK